MMNAKEAAEEVQNLERRIRGDEGRLKEIKEERPRHSLTAARGDTKGLEKLDAESATITARVATLREAVRQAKWEGRRGAEARTIPYMQADRAALLKVKQGLSHLITVVGQEREARQKLQEEALALRVRDIPFADPSTSVLRSVSEALAIAVEVPWLPPEAPTIEDIDNELYTAIQRFEERAKQPGPKSPPDPNRMRTTGTLAAMVHVPLAK